MSRTKGARNFELVRAYLVWMQDTRGRAASTVYEYSRTLTLFLDHLGSRGLGDATLQDLEAFIDRPRRGAGRRRGVDVGGAATRAKDVAVVRSMYSYLVDRGTLTANPAALLGAPTVRNHNPRPVPDHDWLKIWRSDLELSDRVWLGLGFYAGLRRRELCELTPAQVFVPGRRLVGFVRKGGGDDIMPYGDCLDVLGEHLPHLMATTDSSGPDLKATANSFEEALAEYVDKRGGHRFLLPFGEEVPTATRERGIHKLPPGMTNPSSLNKRGHKLYAAADTKHYTPHQLRHSFVTNLLRAGVPLYLVQRLANHSSPSVTGRYIKAGSAELREWLAKNVNRHGT